jgi:hypothetical protein
MTACVTYTVFTEAVMVITNVLLFLVSDHSPNLYLMENDIRCALNMAICSIGEYEHGWEIDLGKLVSMRLSDVEPLYALPRIAGRCETGSQYSPNRRRQMVRARHPDTI